MTKIPDRLLNDPPEFNGPPPASARLQHLPYPSLPWETFETLCCRLARRSTDIVDCRPYGVGGEKQDGIDLYGRRSGETKYVVYQCKRQKDFTPAKIREAVKTFLEEEWAEKSEEFVLCTQESLRKRERAKEVEKQKLELRPRGIVLNVWDAVELDLMLKDDPQTVYDFFGMVWCEGFCGEERAKEVKQRRPPPPRNVFPKVEDYLGRFVVKLERENSHPFSSGLGKSLEEVVLENKWTALLGPANYGKSTELRQLAYVLSKTKEYYPFIVQLKNYTGLAIADTISGINDLPHRLVVVLLDGLDEVPSGAFDNVRRQVQKFSSDYPEVRIVISCRMNFYVAYLKSGGVGTLEGFAAYKLKDISHGQMTEYIASFKVEGQTLDKEAFLREIRIRRFERFLYLPYYLRRFAHEFVTTGQLAKNILELTDRFIKESIKKDVDRYFLYEKAGQEAAIYNTLQKVAFICESRGKNTLTWSELQSFVTNDEVTLLKAASSLIEGSESDDISWSFIHNTIQEALVAGILKDRSASEIRAVICFKPDYSRLKPSWANVLSLLVSAVDDVRRRVIIDWLNDDQKDVIIRFEAEFIDAKVRFDLFQNIFESYSKKETRINSWKFDLQMLATFARDLLTAKFLLGKLALNQDHLVRADALQILSTYNIAVDFPEVASAIKKAIEANLYGTKNLPNMAIFAYCRGFKLSDVEFERLFNYYKGSSDNGALISLYEGILEQRRHEEYLEEILELIRLFMESKGDENGGVTTNIPSALRECVIAVTSEKSVEKIVAFMRGRFEMIFYSTYFREIIDFTILVAGTFKGNLQIYKGIEEIFVLELESSRNALNDLFTVYFDTITRTTDAFRALYNSESQPYAYRAIRLSEIANEESVDFMIEEFSGKRISKEDVILFQMYLQRNEKLLSRLNAGLNKTEPIPLPEKRDFHAEKLSYIKTVKEIIFDVDKFIGMMASMFDSTGSNELDRKQIWLTMFRDERRQYPRMLYDALPKHINTISKELAIDRIKTIWPRFWAQELYNFLKSERDVDLDSTELEAVLDWCKKQLQTWRFTEVTSKEGSTHSVKNNSIFVSFFIRHFGFRSLSKQVYLDLLSFYKWDDREEDIFEFVTSVLPGDDVAVQVLKNLGERLLAPPAFENHLKYAQQHKLKSASSLLIPYIVDTETFKRHDVLKTFVELNGDLIHLEKILPSLDDDMECQVIFVLINKSSEFAKNYLRKRIKIERGSKKGTTYAYLLSLSGDRNALKSVLDSIELTKKFPVVQGPGYVNFLAVSKERWMMPYLFRAIELGYDDAIEHTHILNLRDMAVSALNEMCVASTNFPRTRTSLSYVYGDFGLDHFLLIEGS